MTMKKRIGGLILAIALLSGPAFVVETADPPAPESPAYIEVHGPDIAYVPLTETFVKYDGQIRRIAGFAAMVDDGTADCRCPNCCDGKCYIIITTDLILPGGPIRILARLWIDC